jgi:cell division protein ZapA
MSKAAKTIDVKILDKELRIACPEEEQTELMAAVVFLDKRMREIRDAGKIASVERIALMAALNITHELLGVKVGRGVDLGDFTRRINAMQELIDTALAEQESLF